MRLQTACLIISLSISATTSFTPIISHRPLEYLLSREHNNGHGLSVSMVEDVVTTDSETSADPSSVTYDSVNKMTFRELQKECKSRGLVAVGNTATLRNRILSSAGVVVNNIEDTDVKNESESTTDETSASGISFSDESDKDFEFNSLSNQILFKAREGHWKAAVRKLKQLKKKYASETSPISSEIYDAVLETTTAFNLQGGRACIPTRKLMEDMAEMGYTIPPKIGNRAVVTSCTEKMHVAAGSGIDNAMAMLAALEASDSSSIELNTLGALVSALCREGSLDEAILLLRAMVVDFSFTPGLNVFEDVAKTASQKGDSPETALQVMTLAKAAGYELDTIGSAVSGRSILASGLIASERMDNLALGLRILTAASKAEGCAPDRGDDLVCSSSAAAQRAGTLIHKRTIEKAVLEGNWKLAVKVMELMAKRSLKPSTATLRRVVTVCAKCEKSRKATALILDWVKLYEQGKAEKPPINVFNTVINACEICGEEELTLLVLESMKKTHSTDGNIITINIALKRLAKIGNTLGIEGIIIGALKEGMEPSVVSYTTAIAACAKDGVKDGKLAFEWLKRMGMRNVRPNYHTYNTALAACLDGSFEGTVIGSKVAKMMLEDMDRELASGFEGNAEYNSVMPDTYTKVEVRKLMKQLRENWRNGDVNMAVAKATIRVPFLKLVDFNKEEAMKNVTSAVTKADGLNVNVVMDEEDLCLVENDECEIEYKVVNMLHREGARIAEI